MAPISLGIPENFFMGYSGSNFFIVFLRSDVFFSVLICAVLVVLLVPKHESRQWHQNVLVAIVFFIAHTLWFSFFFLKSVSLKNALNEVVRNNILFIKS